jgi:HD-GYP domain-containing protein (c-di-GMP phosphodiesterase class II)
VFVFAVISATELYYAISNVEQKVKDKAVSASKILAKENLGTFKSVRMHDSTKIDILKNTSFHLFVLNDASGETIFSQKSRGYESIINEISKNDHTFTLHDDNETVISIAHNHEANIYYLDVYMPWEVDGELGELHTFYEATEQLSIVYAEWKSDIIQMGIVLIIFLAGIYPTILLLHKGLLKKTQELTRVNLEILNLLGNAVAKRDSDTNTHNYRVTFYAALLGESIGLQQSELKSLIQGAFLHDIGKIGIPDAILLKPDKLSHEEFELMKSHVTIGKEIIEDSSLLKGAKEVLEYHHERYDGKGYVKGLSGKDIPINARVFAIADVFDALTSRRPYKEAFSFEKAKEIMLSEAGTHFDPELVHRFFDIICGCYEKISEMKDEKILKSMLTERIEKYYS